MRYRDTTLPIAQISQELGTGSILEGSIRKAGNKLRITAQLIHARNDRHIWSETYDRELSDIFAIQSDIAEKVAEALKVQLLSKEKRVIERKATSNTEAYSLYLKGRYYWNERTKASVIKAIRYFEEATKADSNFALAYAGLADAYFIMSDYQWMAPQVAGPLAQRYASKAIVADDGLAEAHASLGSSFLNNSWDFASAEKNRQEGDRTQAKLSGRLPLVRYSSDVHGKVRGCHSYGEAVNDLDPYSRVLNQAIGVSLYYLRRFDESLKQLDEVIDANPDFPAAHFWKSIVLGELGRFPDAIKEGERAVELDGTVGLNVSLAWAHARSGDREAAIRIINGIDSNEKSIVQPSWVGIVRFELGKKRKLSGCFEELARHTIQTSSIFVEAAIRSRNQ